MEREGSSKKPSLISRLSSRISGKYTNDPLIASPRNSNAGSITLSSSRLDGSIRNSIYTRVSAPPSYNEEDVNSMIFRANEPPNYDGGFYEIITQIQARKFYTKQFQAIQEQVEMGNNLYFSNISPTF